MDVNNSYVVKHIKKMLLEIDSITKKERELLLKRDMPYSFTKVGHFLHPRNRDYVPLCIRSINEPFPTSYVGRLYNSYFEDLNVKDYMDKLSRGESFYLYTDETSPWLNKKNLDLYLSKIRKIYNLDI